MSTDGGRAVLPWVASLAALAISGAAFVRAGGKAALPVASPVDAPDPAFEAEPLHSELVSLDARVLALEAAWQRLLRQDASAAQTSDLRPAGMPDVLQRLDALDAEVSRLGMHRALESEEGQKRLRALIREERESIDAAARQRWRQRADTSAREFVVRFAEEENLTVQQREGIEQVVQREQEERTALFERMRTEQAAPGEWRAQMAELRDRAERGMREHLSEGQLEQFREKQRAARQGGF